MRKIKTGFFFLQDIKPRYQKQQNKTFFGKAFYYISREDDAHVRVDDDTFSSSENNKQSCLNRSAINVCLTFIKIMARSSIHLV